MKWGKVQKPPSNSAKNPNPTSPSKSPFWTLFWLPCVKSNTLHVLWRFPVWKVTFQEWGNIKNDFQQNCNVSLENHIIIRIKRRKKALYMHPRKTHRKKSWRVWWNFTEGELCEHARSASYTKYRLKIEFMDWFTRENWKMCWYLPTNENKLEIFEHGIKILKMSKKYQWNSWKKVVFEGGYPKRDFWKCVFEGGYP